MALQLLGVALIAMIVALMASIPLSATGFYLNQQGAMSMGRVDAGNTVAADNLSTIFFNPAGLTDIVGSPQVSKIPFQFDFHLIVPSNDQVNRGSMVASPGTLGSLVPIGGTNGHNPTDPTPIGNVYVAVPLLHGRAAAGFGFNSPFGLSTTFNPDWFGRYDSIDASLKTYNYSFVGAYRFKSRLTVGGGFDVQHANASLTTAIPNPVTPGGPTVATDGRISTTGGANTPGFNVGALFNINKTSRVGVHYRSSMKHEVSGSSTITGFSGALASLNGQVGARANLNLPAIVSLGISTRVHPSVLLFGEAAWFGWNTFNEIRIRFSDGRPDAVRPLNYRDAYSVAAGAEYAVNAKWSARGGIHFDTTPTVDSFRETTAPDSDRLWVGFGASVRVANNAHIDVAYNHAFFRDTTIGVTRTFFDNSPLATTAVLSANVNTAVNNLAAGLRFGF